MQHTSFKSIQIAHHLLLIPFLGPAQKFVKGDRHTEHTPSGIRIAYHELVHIGRVGSAFFSLRYSVVPVSTEVLPRHYTLHVASKFVVAYTSEE